MATITKRRANTSKTTSVTEGYVLHLYQHPSLWNGIVLVLAVVLVTGLMWPKLFPKKQSR